MSETYQGGRTGGVAGLVTRPHEHGLHLVPGEVTGIQVGANHGAQESLVILELCGDRLLLRPRVGALLHGRQDTRLLALWHTPESHGCNNQRNPLVKQTIQKNNLEELDYL